MPRSKSDIVSPERVESLRLELAELLERRAELEALLQFPLTVESMKKKKDDLEAEFEMARTKAIEAHDSLIQSLNDLALDERRTLDSQKARLKSEQTQLGTTIKQLDSEIATRQAEISLLDSRSFGLMAHIGKLKDELTLAENALKTKNAQMDIVMSEFYKEGQKLEAEKDSIERAKAELKAKDHNLANLQTVLNMQLAEARERLTEVEKRERAVAAAHTQNCQTYNDLIVKAATHEEAYAEKSRQVARLQLLTEEEAQRLKDKEADLAAREKDLATNWEVFKKEKAKHEWATRGQ